MFEKKIKVSKCVCHNFIKQEAERAGFTVVELNIATNLGCGESLGPVHWLKTRWHDLIHEVLIEMMKNAPDLGNVSPEEARKALIEATGDVEEAVKKCTEERKKKVEQTVSVFPSFLHQSVHPFFHPHRQPVHLYVYVHLSSDHSLTMSIFC